MQSKDHWDHVYETKAPDAVSWFAPHLVESLGYIERTGAPRSAAVIDVGGGEATLVDDLLDAGYQHVSVLDISGNAIEYCRKRLAERASSVKWIVASVLEHSFEPISIDVWHDRAVFHFLTTNEQRLAYVEQVLKAVKPGGYAIVGTFGPHGPEQCSGLPVARYSPGALRAQFGSRFRLVESALNTHTTPWGTEQQFVYCFCRLER